MKKKLQNKKGFTLMEMLIVVAIIAILVAIAIPTFAGSLDRARVSADSANIRAWYAETIVESMLAEPPVPFDAAALQDDLEASVELQMPNPAAATVDQTATDWSGFSVVYSPGGNFDDVTIPNDFN